MVVMECEVAKLNKRNFEAKKLAGGLIVVIVLFIIKWFQTVADNLSLY